MHVDTLTDKVTARQADSQVKWPNRLKLNNNVKEQNKKKTKKNAYSPTYYQNSKQTLKSFLIKKNASYNYIHTNKLKSL